MLKTGKIRVLKERLLDNRRAWRSGFILFGLVLIRGLVVWKLFVEGTYDRGLGRDRDLALQKSRNGRTDRNHFVVVRHGLRPLLWIGSRCFGFFNGGDTLLLLFRKRFIDKYSLLSLCFELLTELEQQRTDAL